MDLLGRYLSAIGLPGARSRPADLPLLRDVLRGHLATFPYETLGMALGDTYLLDPEGSVARALDGRPGYCYTQNTAFAWVLERLGFDVRRHLGNVTGRTKPEPGAITGGHMALTVVLDGVEWLADAGVGPGPSTPTPLVEGPFADGPWRHELVRSPVPGARWRLVPDPALQTLRCLDFRAEVAPLEAFLPLHEARRRIGEPGTPYFSVQRVVDHHVEAVIGIVQRRDAEEVAVLDDVEAWTAAVAGLGCRALEGRDPGVVAALHARLTREHAAFAAS